MTIHSTVSPLSRRRREGFSCGRGFRFILVKDKNRAFSILGKDVELNYFLL